MEEKRYMEIKDVRLSLLNSNSAVKAIGSFNIDGVIAIRGVRVMEDKNGCNFVAFPSREKSDGSYKDIVFPITKEAYKMVTDTVLAEYNKIK